MTVQHDQTVHYRQSDLLYHHGLPINFYEALKPRLSTVLRQRIIEIIRFVVIMLEVARISMPVS